MSLVVLEGLDKCGKTTVAQYFVKQGYEYVHMSAPAKGHTHATYLAEMLTIIANTAGKDVIFDRSFWGELIWPDVYHRPALLFDGDVILLRALCESIHNDDVRYIYMHDPDKEAHKKRMIEYKEPSYDYDKVCRLYDWVMTKNNFKFLTFNDAKELGWI